ncbi:MAG TPA: transcription elongation factor GreB [Bdellovibrionales bacterium]|nr:MAG: transcription elongation factor GreB [Bdellovibrionales bacterium GWB1_52_6]OFZ06005.1 MAG: transcription elongation factor GreB [Bdellovibrionales bacterium GWA1_52_35]OFZ33055.1 MAG: transcription elongation factor GreB [Bdellovibrionales bacterium GWC1_52_8]HAR41697.1 transcription elongation factor GreB [Bdellovibrionales bacterium]HCM39372.1 transcription elongation factor GreB [Bdellovibrionales bacterium]
MSKAFTKESDNDAEAPDEENPNEGIPVGLKNYITPSGAQRLKDELKTLLHQERPALVQTISWAASNGDRSENGDYIYGKRRLREIDRRIRFLTKRLEKAIVVDPATQNSQEVLFGATVTVRDENERKRKFRIVGIDETNVAQGDVSWISPIAKALLHTRSGDVITFRSPKGEEELEILEIRYEAKL